MTDSCHVWSSSTTTVSVAAYWSLVSTVQFPGYPSSLHQGLHLCHHHYPQVFHLCPYLLIPYVLPSLCSLVMFMSHCEYYTPTYLCVIIRLLKPESYCLHFCLPVTSLKLLNSRLIFERYCTDKDVCLCVCCIRYLNVCIYLHLSMILRKRVYSVQGFEFRGYSGVNWSQQSPSVAQ